MSVKIKPSRPFSNGIEYLIFHEDYCERRTKHKVDSDGMARKGNCKVEDIIAIGDEDAWGESVANVIVQMGGRYHVYLRFEDLANKPLQRKRKKSVKQVDGQESLL